MIRKREPKHMGEVMSDIAERYNKLTKTKMSELISPCCNEELILVAAIDTRRLYKCSKCKNYTKPKQR